LWVIFALLDPDPRTHWIRLRIRIHNTEKNQWKCPRHRGDPVVANIHESDALSL
jgi:hypothetical protein